MRKRKRPDWPIRVFRFAIKPIGELPQEMFSVAKRMQVAWNKLVDLRETISQEVTAIADITAEQKKELWNTFSPRAKDILNDGTNGFNFTWECKQEILDRFHRALVLKQNPKKQYELRSFSIPRIFNAGGRELTKLFQKDISGISLRPVRDEYYDGYTAWHQKMRGSKGYFEISKDLSIDFLVNLSMKIPTDGFLKRITLTGQKNSLGWKFWIILTCEYPPSLIENILPDLKCGLDLGWRRFADYIRIGMLVNQNGEVKELKLPLAYTNNQSRKKRLKFPNDPNQVIESWFELEELNQKIGLHVESIKEQLKKSMPKDLPENIASSFAHLGMMRQSGIKRLGFELEKANIAHQSQLEIKEWLKSNLQLEQKLQRSRDRLLRNREIHYRLLSKELANSYSQIGWENDLSLKTMAEDSDLKMSINPGLKNSMYYRHMVSLYQLRTFLKDATRKAGSNLSLTKAKNTTAKCCVCDGDIVNDGKLIQVCVNKHKLDQDINAATNLLKSIDNSFDLTKIKKYLVS